MAQKSIHKKQTREDKFTRKFWVNNKAKRVWLRYNKRQNAKKIRRITKEDTQKYCTREFLDSN